MNSGETTQDAGASSKKSRVPYSSLLTDEQQAALRAYFAKNRYPKHAEKTKLSESLKIDPYFLNKWFHGERGRFSKQNKVSKKHVGKGQQQVATSAQSSKFTQQIPNLSVKNGGIAKTKIIKKVPVA